MHYLYQVVRGDRRWYRRWYRRGRPTLAVIARREIAVQPDRVRDVLLELLRPPRQGVRARDGRGVQLHLRQRRGQNRVYTPRDRTRLKLILRGKRLGFSITEIGEILDLYDAPDGEQSQLAFFVGKIRARKAALEDQARDLAAVLAELNEVEQRCTALMMPNEDA